MTISRRQWILQTGLALAADAPSHRYAICNETFEGSSFLEGCRLARAAGYTGLELAPGTMGSEPSVLSASQRKEYRNILLGEGLRYAGMHLLVSVPAGMHLTTNDTSLRNRSWDFLRRLVDVAGDLANGELSPMALGSGKQRSAVDGVPVEDATQRLRDGLAALSQPAGDRKVEILLEPLAPAFSNVVNTVAAASAIVRSIGSPAIRTMFDTHNTVAETDPHDQVIRRFASDIRHVHLNEMDGRHPGTGAYDFGRVLRTLSSIGYRGWVSIEVFQFKPSGERIAYDTMAYLHTITKESTHP
jgi:sugar phosphate isomerase/epimerase